jgi:hypothetical protein
MYLYNNSIDFLNNIRGLVLFKHIKNKNTTYFLHMKHSLYLSYNMLIGGSYLFIHSIFPNLFETKGSTIIKELNKLV